MWIEICNGKREFFWKSFNFFWSVSSNSLKLCAFFQVVHFVIINHNNYTSPFSCGKRTRFQKATVGKTQFWPLYIIWEKKKKRNKHTNIVCKWCFQAEIPETKSKSPFISVMQAVFYVFHFVSLPFTNKVREKFKKKWKYIILNENKCRIPKLEKCVRFTIRSLKRLHLKCKCVKHLCFINIKKTSKTTTTKNN